MMQTMASSARDYWREFERRPLTERRMLAHIKRLLEHVSGDEQFREDLAEHIETPLVLRDRYGLELDPALLRPLWDRRRGLDDYGDLDTHWPLAALWGSHIAKLLEHRATMRASGDPAAASPAFSAWRQRQIARVDLEIGPGADGIVHPLVAFELADGCSVGCWFCGISAKKFAGHQPYDAATDVLWRGVLSVMHQRFGPAMQSGFLYWGTDPIDNPDYLQFMETFNEVTGFVPQTTTAAPLRNLDMVKRILRYSEDKKGSLNRFSILTTPILRRVLDAFTPEELMRVELVLQNKGATTSRTRAGRAFDNNGRADVLEGAGTIACVTGFLINIVKRTVQMVSPTTASTRWPNGYRIYAEDTFEDPDHLGVIIDRMVSQNATEKLLPDEVVAFNPIFKFERVLDGFALTSAHNSIQLPSFGGVAALIASGETSLSRLTNDLAREGEDPLEALAFIREIHRAGMLVEGEPT